MDVAALELFGDHVLAVDSRRDGAERHAQFILPDTLERAQREVRVVGVGPVAAESIAVGDVLYVTAKALSDFEFEQKPYLLFRRADAVLRVSRGPAATGS